MYKKKISNGAELESRRLDRKICKILNKFRCSTIKMGLAIAMGLDYSESTKVDFVENCGREMTASSNDDYHYKRKTESEWSRYSLRQSTIVRHVVRLGLPFTSLTLILSASSGWLINSSIGRAENFRKEFDFPNLS